MHQMIQFLQLSSLGIVLLAVLLSSAAGQPVDKKKFLSQYQPNYQTLQEKYRHFTLVATFRKKPRDSDEFADGTRVFVGRRGNRFRLEERPIDGNDERLLVRLVTVPNQMDVVRSGEEGAQFTVQNWANASYDRFMEEVRRDWCIACAPFSYLELDILEFLKEANVDIINVKDVTVNGLDVVHVDFIDHIATARASGSVYGYLQFLRDHDWALSEWCRGGLEPLGPERLGLVNEIHYDFTTKAPALQSIVRYNRRPGGIRENIEQYDVESFSFSALPLSQFSPKAFGLDYSEPFRLPVWQMLLLIGVVLFGLAFAVHRLQNRTIRT
jgi:hypothetical protein